MAEPHRIGPDAVPEAIGSAWDIEGSRSTARPLVDLAKQRLEDHALIRVPAVSALRPTLLGLIRATRPRQWSKNLLVFMAPAAAGVLDRRLVVVHALGAFLVFCVVASGIYLLNDVRDAESDRHHPTKRLRPVAAGEVSRSLGAIVGISLVVIAIAAAWVVSGWVLAVVPLQFFAQTHAVDRVGSSGIGLRLACHRRWHRHPCPRVELVLGGHVFRRLVRRNGKEGSRVRRSR
jgi:decaprenyl-phosphate phosphoribosyltransferase